MLLVVANSNGITVGWLLFLIEGTKAIIELICIDPTYWRQGIGRTLVFSIKEYLPEINHIAVVTRKVDVSPSFTNHLVLK